MSIRSWGSAIKETRLSVTTDSLVLYNLNFRVRPDWKTTFYHSWRLMNVLVAHFSVNNTKNTDRFSRITVLDLLMENKTDATFINST